MIGKYSFSEIATVIGIGLGCLFAAHVLTVMGYFSVIGSQFTTSFIEANLTDGASVMVPLFILLLSNSMMGASVGSLIRTADEVIAGARSKPPLYSRIHPAYIWLPAVVITSLPIFLPDRVFDVAIFYIRSGSYVGLAYLFSMWAVYDWRSTGKFPIGTGVVVLLMAGCAFRALGITQAYSDIESPIRGFSITAEDKNYVNVSVLKMTASAVLLKVGSDIVFYDRSKITKIERLSVQLPH